MLETFSSRLQHPAGSVLKVGCNPGILSEGSYFDTPEEIDDDPNSAPSKRILQLSQRYQEVLHGNIAAQRIGLALMRQKCPHFGEWLDRLESLGQESET